MSAFATIVDVALLTGRTLTEDEQDRVLALLPLVSDLIRVEGSKHGVDVDAKIATDSAYESVVKMITCDVIGRAIKQSTTGDAMSQESQSALGYTWSGTYAVPGGGNAMSLMDRERKMLGFKRQRYGVIELWEDPTE